MKFHLELPKHSKINFVLVVFGIVAPLACVAAATPAPENVNCSELPAGLKEAQESVVRVEENWVRSCDHYPACGTDVVEAKISCKGTFNFVTGRISELKDEYVKVCERLKSDNLAAIAACGEPNSVESIRCAMRIGQKGVKELNGLKAKVDQAAGQVQDIMKDSVASLRVLSQKFAQLQSSGCVKAETRLDQINNMIAAIEAGQVSNTPQGRALFQFTAPTNSDVVNDQGIAAGEAKDAEKRFKAVSLEISKRVEALERHIAELDKRADQLGTLGQKDPQKPSDITGKSPPMAGGGKPGGDDKKGGGEPPSGKGGGATSPTPSSLLGAGDKPTGPLADSKKAPLVGSGWKSDQPGALGKTDKLKPPSDLLLGGGGSPAAGGSGASHSDSPPVYPSSSFSPATSRSPSGSGDASVAGSGGGSAPAKHCVGVDCAMEAAQSNQFAESGNLGNPTNLGGLEAGDSPLNAAVESMSKLDASVSESLEGKEEGTADASLDPASDSESLFRRVKFTIERAQRKGIVMPMPRRLADLRL